MNDVGLVVAISSLGEAGPVSRPGLQWNVIVDIVTYTCATAAEALDVITGAPHLRPLGYLVADAEGHAAVVEASTHGVHVRRPEDDRLIMTNALVAGRPETDIECRRYQQVRELVQGYAEAPDVADVRRVLADHEGEICRGNHEKTEEQRAAAGDMQTLWSVIAVPQVAAFMVAPGLPCETHYELIPFETANEDE
jgi:hypothetical protein